MTSRDSGSKTGSYPTAQMLQYGFPGAEAKPVLHFDFDGRTAAGAGAEVGLGAAVTGSDSDSPPVVYTKI